MRISDKDLAALKHTLEFWGNNCGGCETCGQVFGDRDQPQFDLQELHMIVTELEERRQKEAPQPTFCSDCNCGKASNCSRE